EIETVEDDVPSPRRTKARLAAGATSDEDARSRSSKPMLHVRTDLETAEARSGASPSSSSTASTPTLTRAERRQARRQQRLAG
ncbi:MAG TPA: hypothetical protein VGX76_18745, partial [Pirellulales bacterium]|nr:hypothetical protein [Pirellulales bacterium]